MSFNPCVWLLVYRPSLLVELVELFDVKEAEEAAVDLRPSAEVEVTVMPRLERLGVVPEEVVDLVHRLPLARDVFGQGAVLPQPVRYSIFRPRGAKGGCRVAHHCVYGCALDNLLECFFVEAGHFALPVVGRTKRGSNLEPSLFHPRLAHPPVYGDTAADAEDVMPCRLDDGVVGHRPNPFGKDGHFAGLRQRLEIGGVVVVAADEGEVIIAFGEVLLGETVQDGEMSLERGEAEAAVTGDDEERILVVSGELLANQLEIAVDIPRHHHLRNALVSNRFHKTSPTPLTIGH